MAGLSDVSAFRGVPRGINWPGLEHCFRKSFPKGFRRSYEAPLGEPFRTFRWHLGREIYQNCIRTPEGWQLADRNEGPLFWQPTHYQPEEIA